MKLSIAIPCLNEERRIKELLENLTKQTTKPEIVIVDGGSTDNTVPIIKQYAKKHKNIKLYPETGKHRSPANARNKAFNKSTGDYLTFMDVDETISPNYAQEILKAFKKHPQAEQIKFKSKLITPPKT